MDFYQQILIVHLFTTFAMTGIIWLVHLLTYPTMRLVGDKGYDKYHQFHTSRIGIVVAPLMVLEIFSGAVLFLRDPSMIFYLVNLIGLFVIWINTFFHSVPAHQKLTHHKDAKALEHLIKMNLIRTLVWTARSIALMGGLIYGTISLS